MDREEKDQRGRLDYKASFTSRRSNNESKEFHLEGYHMRFANRYIGSLLLAAAFTAPVAIMAAPAPNDDGVQVRVYDSHHKDYHNWDDRENKSWGVYLNDNHRRPHEYSKSNRKEQNNYWNWRHSHPDND
jgi:hypothetical protein